jgi:hypothetical protein
MGMLMEDNPWGFVNGKRTNSRVDVDGADQWDFFPVRVE